MTDMCMKKLIGVLNILGVSNLGLDWDHEKYQ